MIPQIIVEDSNRRHCGACNKALVPGEKVMEYLASSYRGVDNIRHLCGNCLKRLVNESKH